MDKVETRKQHPQYCGTCWFHEGATMLTPSTSSQEKLRGRDWRGSVFSKGFALKDHSWGRTLVALRRLQPASAI